jgi:ATP/maltotriose-dependent transcriptional regulator MalT
VDLSGYLDQQVLATQPEALRDFLLESSLLEEFDADLCSAVFGKGEWKTLIKTIRQDNLFVLSVGPGGKWLRYHHLFQEFLQQRIHEEEPERAQAILLRLAEVYKERCEWEKAYAIYRKSGDLDALADLIELAGTPMLLSERLITLRAWLEDVPARLLEERPSLLSLKGILLCNFGEGYSALPYLNRAIGGMQKIKDQPDLALALVRRSIVYRLIGDYASSMRDSEEALHLSEKKTRLANDICRGRTNQRSQPLSPRADHGFDRLSGRCIAALHTIWREAKRSAITNRIGNGLSSDRQLPGCPE